MVSDAENLARCAPGRQRRRFLTAAARLLPDAAVADARELFLLLDEDQVPTDGREQGRWPRTDVNGTGSL